MSIKIGAPVKTNRLTQGFGENNACVVLDANNEPYKPFRVVNAIQGTCPVGTVSLYNYLGTPGHAGYDYAAYRGEPVHFDIDTGTQNVEWEAIPIESPEGGVGVLIRSLQPVKLDTAPEMPGASLHLVRQEYERWGGAVHLMRYFGHLTRHNLTQERQRIKTGDIVGFAGDSGATTGVHVHRHLLVVGANNEGPFFYKDGDSDYKGRVREDKYMVNQFIEDVVTDTDNQSTIIELLKRKRDLLQTVAALYRKLIEQKQYD